MPEKKILLILLFLTASTLLTFWQVNLCKFINLDDNVYVTENGHVQNGITTEGIRWAFTTAHANFWHPLTWISHMLDVNLFRLEPRGHHLTNLLLHVANTLLLFLVFHRMTKALWQSAFVAALFALHPLHVESVAWVAERKDVLCTFFWMLTMGAYLCYVERPGLLRYLAVIVSFSFGLLAKPMLVTLPFVLLLLDFWPLKRFEQKITVPETRTEAIKPASADKRKGKSGKKPALKSPVKAEKTAVKTEQAAAGKSQWALMGPLMREKIPLFALTVISCIATYLAQQQGGAVKSIEAFPMSVRISNAFVSYILYIAKMIWPSDLAVLYPHPGMWPLWQVLGAVILFVVVTVMAVWKAKRFPYAAVGWLWYAGTLVPVIGIVQVGDHAMADRYTYVPLIGLFIIVAWGIPELLKGWHWRKQALAASSALILLCLIPVTWAQVGYWQNSITLFDHTLNVTSQNKMIYNNRGLTYGDLGDYTRAIQDYDRAIDIYPKYVEAYYNRGIAYSSLGDHTRAIRDYDRAIEIDPRYARAYNNRGNAYTSLGNQTRAIADFDRAIEIDPQYARAYYNRGMVYYNLGNREKAVEDVRTAARLGSEAAKKLLRSSKINW